MELELLCQVDHFSLVFFDREEGSDGRVWGEKVVEKGRSLANESRSDG